VAREHQRSQHEAFIVSEVKNSSKHTSVSVAVTSEHSGILMCPDFLKHLHKVHIRDSSNRGSDGHGMEGPHVALRPSMIVSQASFQGAKDGAEGEEESSYCATLVQEHI
jgi:hypothetical protein